MAIDRSLIGKSSSLQTFEVTREAVERFMQATEDPALQQEGEVDFAPPTFPTTFRVRVPDVEIDPTRMQHLHGEQEYSYTRQLRIGETVTCVSRIVDVRERSGKSGSMTFLVTELVGTDSKQQPVFSARSTAIIRTSDPTG